MTSKFNLNVSITKVGNKYISSKIDSNSTLYSYVYLVSKETLWNDKTPAAAATGATSKLSRKTTLKNADE